MVFQPTSGLSFCFLVCNCKGAADSCNVHAAEHMTGQVGGLVPSWREHYFLLDPTLSGPRSSIPFHLDSLARESSSFGLGKR